MMLKSITLILLIISGVQVCAQVTLNSDGSQPHPSAMLDVKSQDRGLLPPRMTYAEISAVASPAAGLIIFCTDCGPSGHGALVIFQNGNWFSLSAGCLVPSQPASGNHPAGETEITWTWQVVPSASGYKWNSVNDVASAIDMGSATTKTETGLTCNTAYSRYVWAYNGCGNSTSLVMNQSTGTCSGNLCGQPVTDIRDGKVYNTVTIGTQCWMKENMNIGIMIPSNIQQTNALTIEKYCYEEDESNCSTYGGLYQWENMMQWILSPGTQGICPANWHIPSKEEWIALFAFLGGETVAGGKMKETGATHWYAPNTGATNSSGFTALPGGYSQYNVYNSIHTFGYLWSSGQYYNFSYAYAVQLSHVNADSPLINFPWDYAYSVRCIRN